MDGWVLFAGASTCLDTSKKKLVLFSREKILDFNIIVFLFVFDNYFCLYLSIIVQL
jgi:hypothetical protein